MREIAELDGKVPGPADGSADSTMNGLPFLTDLVEKDEACGLMAGDVAVVMQFGLGPDSASVCTGLPVLVDSRAFCWFASPMTRAACTWMFMPLMSAVERMSFTCFCLGSTTWILPVLFRWAIIMAK